MISSKFADLPNPYDFANPVCDPRLFAGRSSEMEEVQYYLDQATRAARPINLAIIGDRASGKTSLLNMIEFTAEERGLCAVRIELDEGDAESQLAFFAKLYDALLTEAVSDYGAFGGVAGNTYDVYRDMVDAYETPVNNLFCPFIFPIQYAKAMRSGNPSVVVSDTALKRDLMTMRQEIQRPVILLMDECDILSRSRVHLEKLRNIFMNVPGYMLVLTGTQSLFPLVNDVFSPIVRQFKRIPLGPFRDTEDTEQCIRGPLKQVGISHPSEIFDFETYKDVTEIHDLCGGRPYEIQLICHILFRRVQQGRATRMHLTVDVLDEVLSELQQTQDVRSRPVISAVRALDDLHLRALSLLSIAHGGTAVGQAWFSHYLLHGEDEWTEEELRQCLGHLEDEGVVGCAAGLVEFLGDDFDRVYCKYLARKHGVPLDIWDLPWEVSLAFDLDEYLSEALQVEPLNQIIPASVLVGTKPEAGDLVKVASVLAEVATHEDPFAASPLFAQEIYWASLEFASQGCFVITILTLVTPWGDVSRMYRSACDDVSACEGRSKLETAIEPLKERAESHGATLCNESVVLSTVPIQGLEAKLLHTANARLRERIGDDHVARLGESYAERHDADAAFLHARLAHQYLGRGGTANNLGYLTLARGDRAGAQQLFEEALRIGEDTKGALPHYNLAVVHALDSDLHQAIEHAESAIEQAAHLPPSAREMLCLFSLEGDSASFNLVENLQPDLLDAATRLGEVIAAHSSQPDEQSST